MQEYIENGLPLGWLINPQDKQAEIYQPGKPVEIVQLPTGSNTILFCEVGQKLCF
jgi:Uma2 family endonuclease